MGPRSGQKDKEQADQQGIGSGASVQVRAQPKASRSQVDCYRGDILLLRVTSPPEGGKTNLAVISLLAEALDVPKSRLRIVRGHTSREKLVTVELLTPEDVEQRLSGFTKSL